MTAWPQLIVTRFAVGDDMATRQASGKVLSAKKLCLSGRNVTLRASGEIYGDRILGTGTSKKDGTYTVSLAVSDDEVQVVVRPVHADADTSLDASKNYMDMKFACSEGLPHGVHFQLIEGVADHICETLFLQDQRVEKVEVKIVKLALSEAGEKIGITLTRERR